MNHYLRDLQRRMKIKPSAPAPTPAKDATGLGEQIQALIDQAVANALSHARPVPQQGRLHALERQLAQVDGINAKAPREGLALPVGAVSFPVVPHPVKDGMPDHLPDHLPGEPPPPRITNYPVLPAHKTLPRGPQPFEARVIERDEFGYLRALQITSAAGEKTITIQQRDPNHRPVVIMVGDQRWHVGFDDLKETRIFEPVKD